MVIPHLVNHVARTTSNLFSQLNSWHDPHSLSFQHSIEHRASCHLLLRHFSVRLGLIYFVVNDCLNSCHIIKEIGNSDVVHCLQYLYDASPIMEQLLNCQSYSVDHQRLGTVYCLPLEHLTVNQCPNLNNYLPFRCHFTISADFGVTFRKISWTNH